MSQVKKKSFIQKNGLIAVWSMAGLIASGYIAFLFMGNPGHDSSVGKIANAITNSSIGRTSTPVQQEVASLRAHVSELKDREEKLAKKISKIEQSLGPITASISDNTTGYGIDDENAPVFVDRDKTANVAVKILPLLQDDSVGELFSETSSQSYGISLASARSVDALERHWDYLRKTAGTSFNDVQPRYVRRGSPTLPVFELIAGPFERMSEARARCDQLTRLNIDCASTRVDNSFPSEFQNAGSSLRK